MKLYKTAQSFLIEVDGQVYQTAARDWDELINRDDLYQWLQADLKNWVPVTDAQWQDTCLAPIQSQEIWAAGVTYWRSRDARMEESKAAGGATFYDKVYEAERPEIFFKANALRTVGQNGFVRIRKDSTWDVPEPELTLFITNSGKIVAYTIGNDMSSRSIEGENPLYLPQAKSYDGCAALGPCLYIPEAPIDPAAQIRLHIRRDGAQVFAGQIGIDQMRRKHAELAGYLFRECTFPHGCFLMTGTGIVPDPPFTLQSGDEIAITIDPIGTLTNTVA
jgi:2-dehydro-3-deoxy-D-arabinonate dehydratase